MVIIGDRQLSLDDFLGIVLRGEEIVLNSSALAKVDTNYRFLKKFSAHKLIYGINTGFGPMAQYKVNEDKILELQYNLIRSHSSGGGKILSHELSKAIMSARLNTLMLALRRAHRIGRTVERTHQ